MKLILILICFFAIAVNSYAQKNKSAIKKAYAFIEISNPGTIMKDDNGNLVKPTLIVNRFIYIEIKGNKKPDIENVQYKNEILNATILPVDKFPEEAGRKKMANEKILISPSNGNTLWKIELQPFEPKKIINSPSPNKIIINEVKDGKRFKFIIDRDVELEGPMYG